MATEEMTKEIVAVIDNQTCALCATLDGADPGEVGYPPFHEPDEDGRICRCVVRDIKEE